MGRAPCCDKTKVRKGPWTREEDARLIAYIRDYGHNNWRALPQEADLARCGKSCRLRWVNYLKPDVKRGPFTLEEEEMILKLHETLGNKWSRIAAHFPGRTDNEIKNVWNSYFKKKLAGVDFLSRKKKKVNSSSSNNNNNNSNDDDDNNDIHGYSPFSQSTSTISSISIEGSSPNQALGNDGQNDPFLVEAMGNFQFENVMEDEFPLGAESSRNWEVDEGPSQLHYQQPPPMDQPKCQSSVTDIKEGGGRGGEGDKGTEESDLEWMTNLENYLRQDQTTNNDVFDFAPWFSPIPKL